MSEYEALSYLWCYQPFGPPLLIDPTISSYECRLTKGHEGPHRCFASDQDNYVDVAPSPTREQNTEDARRVGGR